MLLNRVSSVVIIFVGSAQRAHLILTRIVFEHH